MKEMKRILSLVLCLVMLVGLIPAGALTVNAAGETIYVLAGSDFQEQPDDTTTKKNNVSAILDKVDDTYSTMNGLLFGGDYSSSATSSSTDVNALKSAVQGKYPNLANDNMVCIQGNHDPNHNSVSEIAVSGNNDEHAYNGAYGVYVINEDDFPWNGDATEDGVKAVADDLEDYLQDKIDDKYTKPIFVISHLPLHYTFRTPARGDGRYAQYIFDVLNDAGEQGLNIIFLFGHNHSEGYDTYLGGGAIFLKENDPIWIADPSSYTANPVEYKLNFTYMNCGYVGYSGDTADSTKTMSVFEITGDKVTISRYSANGVYQMKTAGVDDKNSCTYNGTNYYDYQPKANTTTYGSPQTVTLKQFVPAVTVEDKTTNITVTAPGITGVTASQNTNRVYDSVTYSAYASYDIELTGYTDGNTATVTIPAPAGFDTSKSAVVLYDGAIIATDTNISDGITFTTNHFSTYDIAQYAETAVVSAEGKLVSSYLEQAMTKNDLEEGVGYLIVPANEGGSRLTLTNQANGTGLLLQGTVSVDNTNLWYLDLGTNFANEFIRWGAPTGENNYLNVTNGGASVGGTGNRVTKFEEHGDGVFALGRNGVWLNRNSGGSSTKADGYGTDDGNSRWYFYKVVKGTGAAVTLQVAPNTVNMMPKTTKDLAHAVLVGGEETSDYTITWTSSNTNVATVNNKGVVTGVADGTATITATLTDANGQDVDGTLAVNINVTVATKEIKSVTVDSMEGTVERGSKATTETGSTLTITFEDNSTETIPVTVGMLSGDGLNVKANGTYEKLTVTYAGKTVTGYTLTVVDVVGNDFPSYPEGGSVKVNKTGAGQDFQNTGVARIELSTSGLPSKKGADLIVMVDTSSSMRYDTDAGEVVDGPTRLSAIHNSLRELAAVLKTPDANGEYLDVDIAIADFNDFTTLPGNDYFTAVGGRTPDTDNSDYAIFTGDGDLIPEAGDFVGIEDLNIETIIGQVQQHNGTNYDYAFQTIYDLAAAKQAANEEERDLYVIFMSDGAPYQYNYYTGNISADTGYEDTWDRFLTGELTDFDWANFAGQHRYFYNEDGRHWMAEAIKGDPDQMYTVIRGDAANYGLIDVTGDGTPDEYMTAVPGLGATMYTIGLGLFQDGVVEASTADWVIKNVASTDADGNPLYVSTYDADELIASFANIASAVRYAAQNAYFVDQMGDDYNLQMNPNIVDSSDNTRTNISTDITVKEYPIYTKADLEADKCTADDIGKAYGDGTVLETVWFKEVEVDGKAEKVIEAYSDQIYTTDDNGTKTYTNILIDSVICAKTFFYNTTSTPKTITLANGKPYELPGETFYWNIGLINEKQFTLSYAVYLTGSMEGTRPEGSYDTNNYATLYYTNWLGNDVHQDVESPTMPWGGANVSYAFYLVNSEGKPVDANGVEVPNIVTAYKVTRPVLYDTINLNSGEVVSSMETIAKNVLPTGYNLYDTEAVYTVEVNSGNGGGGWTITGNYPVSTYVTGYAGGQDYSNETPVDSDSEENPEYASYDYTSTTVYFAVVWTIGTVPDTVVIDYGLPVDISVMANDMFGNEGTLVGVGETAGTLTDKTGFDDTYTGTYGEAKLNGTKVRYTPANMEMNGYEKFAYAVNYTGTNPGYYYGSVTVIPATTIYYEDNFLTYTASKTTWEDEGTAISDATQAEDRPGRYSLTDANNIYGYDGVNLNMAMYSLGTAKKVHVDADSYATASFTFYGTGFDIISMTSNTTGVLAVKVTAAEDIMVDGTVKYAKDVKVKSTVVDTYYGCRAGLFEVTYTYNGTTWVRSVGNEITTDDAKELINDVPTTAEAGDSYINYEYVWVSEPDETREMFQVPILQANDLPYGKYTVLLTATYMAGMDATTAEGYDLYLDAIRIYDPANDGAVDNDTVIEDAYKADGEGWPSYIELRNKLIDPDSLGIEDNASLGNDDTSTIIEGLVFIDGDNKVGDAQISDYISYGPNNEVYLAPGQRVAFILSTPDNIANVHIGIKSADGKPGTYTITNIAQVTNPETGVMAGNYYNANTNTISTTTDMYYDLTGYKGDIIVISNTGDRGNYNTEGIISLTNIKSTYTSNPANGAQTVSNDQNDGLMTASEEELTETYIYMTRAASTLTLRSLNSAAQEEVPEETEPETTVPEETEPETTEPEETEPETTIPEETEPETSAPGSGEGSANNSIIGTIIKILLGWLFG